MPRPATISALSKTKILLAIRPQKVDRLQRILEGHQLVVVHHRPEAVQRLEEPGFGMVIVGVHFDDSQMFSLLGDIRLHSRYRKVPVLVVLLHGRFAFSDVVLEAIDHAVMACGANGFLDFDHFPDDAEGNARIRRIVDYLILIDGDLHHIARETKDPDIVSIAERRGRRSPGSAR